MDPANNPIVFHLEQFDGPLDLLLHLISVNRVDIFDIPIALILEQYMQALVYILEKELDNACDFVAMAAQLVLIKTRMLLPRPQSEEEDPRADLVRALLEYKLVKETAPYLSRRIQLGRDAYLRAPSPLPQAKPAEYRQSKLDLVRAAKSIDQRIRRRTPPKAQTFDAILTADPVSVEDKMADILSLLAQDGSLRLNRLYSFARSRSELVAIFLALLELIAGRRAALDDENTTIYTAGD